ncbi:hypothetical protein KEM52_004134 [Ascosphaera acerosa]|nr:hypothetical protein KEM52_004134 [Ascosphaera acerosa]
MMTKPLAPKDFSKQAQKGTKGRPHAAGAAGATTGKTKRRRLSSEPGAVNEDGTAAAAPTGEQTASASRSKVKAKSKSKSRSSGADDTPKAFLRLMQQMQGKKLDRGPDDGNDRRQQKKKKGGNGKGKDGGDEQQQQQAATTGPASTSDKPAFETPKILPGEKLSDFAARVDQAMPLTGISKAGGAGAGLPGGMKIREGRATKHEKHLRRLQKGWREEEARLREKEEEEREEREAAMEELEEQWRALEAEAGPAKRRKGRGKGKKKDDDDDPWASLKKRDKMQAGSGNPLETADAPPQLSKISRPKFKVYGGAGANVENVPGKAGSLRRREELREERDSIVEQYRRLMAEKRAAGQTV